MVFVDRHAHGGVLDGLLNHSPHQPPDRCTAIMAVRVDDDDPRAEVRRLLLTPFDSPFVAEIFLVTPFVDTNEVGVFVSTNEAPVGDASDAFMDRRPATAPLVGGLLTNAIADMFIYQKERAQQ
ncbi:unnamed protein product [Vitrella brassicaformis CCMP3155]|uniref:Uncharacterized protein n=1 Tax=Vitrella brassicaformis (strain CCMP3155) TaxID=1169540 RepID=A0A0G4FTS8_VITBC|nr:unnamed protein product [Vitrella brassicaformis CCMP3155]|eukprot:CEM17827.1 unnamed protein product [Vitrella brassicaformis CCMP3155]